MIGKIIKEIQDFGFKITDENGTEMFVVENGDFSKLAGQIEKLFSLANINHFYSVGDKVKYRNTRGNISECIIAIFEKADSGKWWYYGIDAKTKAKVFCPVHISRELDNCG